ncbi:MAG: glutathione synthase [Arenicellales bacterium]
MQFAFIMNPLSSVKAWKDTTYYIMKACQERGHQVCYLDQQWLWLNHDQLYAKVQWLRVNQDDAEPFTILSEQTIALSQTDAVWLRTDPPFDRRYFYTTILLDYLPEKTRVLNRPDGVRNWNEKLAALKFPAYTPRTIVTNDIDQIKKFAAEQEKITVKPMDGFGGKGIVFYTSGDDDSVLHQATHQGSHWVIAQEYLVAASQGDKRILILNGEPMGAILRLHAEGVELNNLDQGGSAHAAKINDQEMEICRALKPGLIEEGVFFVGLDIIGDKLIEVNVTSPTGLQELCRFNQQDYHHQMIEALER